MTKPNDPASPVDEEASRNRPPEFALCSSLGLTKREYFAAMLCAGMNANSDISNSGYEGGHSPSTLRKCYAESAVKQADALIDALNKTPPSTT